MEVKLSNIQTDSGKPNASINVDVTVFQLMLLIHGYTRTKYKNNRIIPEDINKLIFKWVFINDIMCYEDVLSLLMDDRGCLGVFDLKIQLWRPIVYMKHWIYNQNIMVAFADERTRAYVDGEVKYVDRYTLLNHWPTDNVVNNSSRFVHPLSSSEYELCSSDNQNINDSNPNRVWFEK